MQSHYEEHREMFFRIVIQIEKKIVKITTQRSIPTITVTF